LGIGSRAMANRKSIHRQKFAERIRGGECVNR
jgi:hypothetical protein